MYKGFKLIYWYLSFTAYICSHLDFRASLRRTPVHIPAQRWVNFDFIGSCCGLCPTWSWKSPRTKTTQPLWPSCSNVYIPVVADRMILIHIFLLINLILQFCPIGHSWAQKRKTNFCEIDIEKISSKRHHYSAILHIPFILLSLSLGHLLSLLSFLIYLAIFFYLLLITGNWFHPSLPQPTVLYLMYIKLLCTLFSVDAM